MKMDEQLRSIRGSWLLDLWFGAFALCGLDILDYGKIFFCC